MALLLDLVKVSIDARDVALPAGEVEAGHLCRPFQGQTAYLEHSIFDGMTISQLSKAQYTTRMYVCRGLSHMHACIIVCSIRPVLSDILHNLYSPPEEADGSQ